MNQALRFIYGFLVSLVGLLGLFLSSRAVDVDVYTAGLLMALFAFLYVMWMIGTSDFKQSNH